MSLVLVGVVLPWVIVALGCWIGYQFVQQNGRILLRLDALDDRLERLGAMAGSTRTIDPTRALPMAPSSPPGLPRGAAAPSFALADLEGNMVRLEDFRGRRVLLLSCDPNCGF